MGWKQLLGRAVQTGLAAAVRAGLDAIPQGPAWSIERDGVVERVADGRLREYVRTGALGGLEFVRPEGGDWMPLFATALYQEEAGPGDPRARVVAALRAQALWVGVGAAVLPASLSVTWAVLGAAGVVAGTVGAIALGSWVVAAAAYGGWGLLTWRTASRALSWRPTAAIAPPVLPPRVPGPLGDALARLEAATEGRSELRDQLTALRADVARLATQQAGLASSCEPHEAAAVRAERDAVARRLAGAVEPGLRTALQAQHEACEHRLAAIHHATALLAEETARERTLIHQIEAVRTAVLTGGGADAGEIAGHLRGLSQRLAAEQEVRRAVQSRQPA